MEYIMSQQCASVTRISQPLVAAGTRAANGIMHGNGCYMAQPWIHLQRCIF
jgi:hypothetical protein